MRDANEVCIGRLQKIELVVGRIFRITVTDYSFAYASFWIQENFVVLFRLSIMFSIKSNVGLLQGSSSPFRIMLFSLPLLTLRIS